jgi:2-polyprenyl-6-methoxyphenol hydroxylase-like FAD-dependent oxidoreductase
VTVSKVLIVGGGITGSVHALALARREVEVEVAEIQPVWRGTGHGITIQGNALLAFRHVGVTDAVIAGGVPFDRLRMRNADGSLIVEVPTPYTGGPDLPPTIGALRSDVHDVLCEAVYAAGVTVRLGLTVDAFEDGPDRVGVRFSDGTHGEYDLVVGADGIHSHVRELLGLRARPRSVGMSIWRFVAPRPAEMDCAELYYGGPRYKAGYSPISVDRCYAYILDEELDTYGFDRPLAVVLRERSKGYGGMWGRIRETITDDAAVDHRTIESLLEDGPWYRSRVIAIGDAVHACPPLIAQGAAMCAEDAVILAELVTGDDPVPDALRRFMNRRLPRVRMVVHNSLQLADWESHPGTPGTDPAGVMDATLTALMESA